MPLPIPATNHLVVVIPTNTDAWTGNVGNFSGVEVVVWSGNSGQVIVTSHFRSPVSQPFLGHHNFPVAVGHCIHEMLFSCLECMHGSVVPMLVRYGLYRDLL